MSKNEMVDSAVMLGASFRDPSGFLFRRDGILFRQVNKSYQEHYTKLMSSGLYESLVEDGLLIPHLEVDEPSLSSTNAYKVIQPQVIPIISYPYEWCFSQLKDAALTTLTIHKRALDYGMILKDASAYNIQFHNGHPVLIDTLSFEIAIEDKPWDAYRQFCQHFLAPLALMAKTDVRLNQLLRVYIEGCPLDLTSCLLPGITWLNLGLASHIHLHARMQRVGAKRQAQPDGKAPKTSRNAHLGLIGNLESTVQRLNWAPKGTDWVDYYDSTNYSEEAIESKKNLVRDYLTKLSPEIVWDLGANVGVFSRIAVGMGCLTVSMDVDPGAVERNYQLVKKHNETSLLPLCVDLTNPSPAIGWDNAERSALLERGPADVVMALALIHHLAIANNVPLERLATTFASLGRYLILEFVPKEDSQVQRLLSSRVDIFPDYTGTGFETDFSSSFEILEKNRIESSRRILYLMKSKLLE